MGDKMFDECAAIAAQKLADSYAEAAQKAHRDAEHAWMVSVAKRVVATRTEIRHENGRAYAVEVDRITGLTAEETREKKLVDTFLSKNGVVTYTKEGDTYRVSVSHYSRIRHGSCHGLDVNVSLERATYNAVFLFFVHRANIAMRFKEQCGIAYEDEFTGLI